MKQETIQSTKNTTELYKFKQLFTTTNDLAYISEQVIYLVDKKYKNKDINSFVKFLLNFIFNSKNKSVLLLFNKQAFDLSQEKVLVFLDHSMKQYIIDILDTIKLVLYNAYEIKYELTNLCLSNKSIDFQVFVSFDEKKI